MENVSKTDIQEYAKRNTSPKMPIEAKFVEAYVDSLLNSTSLQSAYEEIKNKIQSKDQFLTFNSYWPDASNLNSEPYRSILAYAMLKKDFFLFQLIAYNLFTGKVKEFFGDNLFTSIVQFTDEHPLHYTDEGTYTDMGSGTVIVGFENYYSPEISNNESRTGSQYQSEEEYEKALMMFSSLITMVKPARINIILFHIPYCFLGGNETYIERLNIYDETDDKYFLSPFKNPDAIIALRNLSQYDLYNTYKTVIFGDESIPGEEPQEISYEREIKESEDRSCVIFSYEIRMHYSSESNTRSSDEETREVVVEDDSEKVYKDAIWNKHIVIQPGDFSNKMFVSTTSYQDDKEYYEGYRATLLRLYDDPNAPVMAFRSTDTSDPNVAALLYRRYKSDDENS